MGTKVSHLSGSRSYDSRLFRAIERNDMTIVRYLVEKHIDINRIENGHTPLNLALHRRNTEVVKMLLQQGCNVNMNPSTVLAPPLVQVAKAGYVPYMELLLQHGCSVNQQTEDGISALHLAVQHKSYQTTLSLVETLLSAGADVNLTDNLGNGALHACADNTDVNVDTVKLICRQPDCLIDLKNSNSKTPLQVALDRRNTIVAEILISETSCDINSRNNFGMSPLTVSVQHGMDSIAYLLLEHKADLSLVDFNKMDALHHACMRGSSLLLDFIQHGADVNAQDLLGRTPLYISSRSGNVAIMDALFESGADLHKCDHERRSPLHAAAGSCNYASIKKLIELGADVNMIDRKGQSAIFHLLYDTSPKTSRCLNLLIDNGATINSCDFSGKTLLHMMIKTGNVPLTRELLAGGACVDVVDDEGYAPLHLAVEAADGPDFLTTKLLLQHNCDPLDLDMFIKVFSNFCKKSIEDVLDGDDWMIKWYINETSNPKTLKVLCRRTIHNALWDNVGSKPFQLKKTISRLPLPKPMQLYLYLTAV